MFFIFKCLLCVAASDGCGEFKEEGYRILFCDENNPNVCAVGCDEEYYPAEISHSYNGKINYYTIIKCNDSVWRWPFEDSEFRLNCKKGCSQPLDIWQPYFLVNQDCSTISVEPQKSYRCAVECREGYFMAPSGTMSSRDAVKNFMDCDHEEQYSWTDGMDSKITCTSGCSRYGSTGNIFKDEFGMTANCIDLGSILSTDGYDENLVSECNLECNNELGYFVAPGLQNYDTNLECRGGGEWMTDTYYLCEQGCKIIGDEFGHLKGYNFACNSEISEGWYNMCTYTCVLSEGFVRDENGVFGSSDVIYCRLGRWNLELSLMRCREKCRTDKDCPPNSSCSGRNADNVTFCK